MTKVFHYECNICKSHWAGSDVRSLELGAIRADGRERGFRLSDDLESRDFHICTCCVWRLQQMFEDMAEEEENDGR